MVKGLAKIKAKMIKEIIDGKDLEVVKIMWGLDVKYNRKLYNNRWNRFLMGIWM